MSSSSDWLLTHGMGSSHLGQGEQPLEVGSRQGPYHHHLGSMMADAPLVIRGPRMLTVNVAQVLQSLTESNCLWTG